MKKKLAAALACRNGSTRLYGKPLQNIDVKNGITVLDYLLDWLEKITVIETSVLGIAEGQENLDYVDFADRRGIPYIIGSEKDVLERLIQCGEKAGATDVLRRSSESPFGYYEAIEEAWEVHSKNNYDFSCINDVVDGVSIEIISMEALKYSHKNGEERHRSEFCSLYIRENKDKFRINYIDVPDAIKRTDLRLTIDNPEDLIVCRAVYEHFKDKAPLISPIEIVEYLDQNLFYKELVDQYVEEGLKTMYL